MPNIPLTEFIDFVVSTGTPRLTKVRQAKCKGDYDPRFDYWKQLREAIVAFHDPNNLIDKNQYFRTFLAGLDNDGKRTTYTPVANNYKRFLGRKNITGLPPRRSNWTHGELTVRVNPEIFLNIDGSRELIKLYFKQEQLSKQKADVVLALLSSALPATANVNQFSVYDSKNNRLIRSAQPNANLMV